MKVVFYFIFVSLSYSCLKIGWSVHVCQIIKLTDELKNIILTDLQLTPEMYNQLRGLQKKAKDLRQEVRNLRRMSQAQAHSVRETIRDTFMKIRWGYVALSRLLKGLSTHIFPVHSITLPAGFTTWIVSHDPGVAQEIGYENTSLLVRDGTILLPLAKVVYASQEVSVSFLTVQKGSCDVHCNPLEWCKYLCIRLWLAAQMLHCWHQLQ